MRQLLAFVIFPVAAYAYASAASLQSAEGKPRSDLFEATHAYVAGAEMARGEKAYRDIIPSHGFFSDGFLSYATLRTGPATMGRLAHVRGIFETLNCPAGYFLAFAASGSPDLGLLSFFLAESMGSAGGSMRMLPATIALALIAAGVRRRKTRYFAAAGACVVMAALTSLDFGLYVALTGAIVALLFSHDRKRSVVLLSSWAAGAFALALIAFAVDGIVIDFLRTSLIEMPRLATAYSLGMVALPEALRKSVAPPESLAAIFDKTSFLYVLWVLVLIALATARISPQATARRRAALNVLRVIAIFIVICAVSYAERHHLHWQFAIPALVSVSIFRMFRSANRLVRAAAPVATLVAIMIGQPTTHLAIAASLRNARGPIEPLLREASPPRARGVYFGDANAAVIDTAHRYVGSHLRPEETFFDFTNRGILFFLLDRDCPIRQLEVAFYERDEDQHDVIRRIESNPRIRAALVPIAPQANAVDGIPNAARAPLVWEYLQQHFEPDFAEGDVAFWRRK